MSRPKDPLHNYRTVGWREWVSLPDLGLRALKVKVDTGARTSALHATGIRYSTTDGVESVAFTVVAELNPRRVIRVRAPLIEKRRVRSSTGQVTLRPVVRLSVILGDVKWPVEVTLVNRDLMGFRMLLGRRALRGRFLVNPGRSFIQSEKLEGKDK